MKKFLGLVLAVMIIAAGSVAAMAAENPPKYNIEDIKLINSIIGPHTDTWVGPSMAYPEDGCAVPVNWNFVRWSGDENSVNRRITELVLREKGLRGNLTLSSLTELETLYCYGNDLTSLNLSGCSKLKTLRCENNKLTDLDLSGCSSLEEMHCYRNNLTTLNLADCSALTNLRCGNNELRSINLSGCSSLMVLHCEANNLTSLDLSGCPDLYNLECSLNKISSLDLSDVPKLNYLSCRNNQLTSLDVSKNPELGTLHCDNNSLTFLDASDCAHITSLQCSNNKLSLLRLINPALQTLICDNNKLETLNVTACTELTHLQCYNNELSYLDIGNCTELIRLDCRYNRLTKSTLVGFDGEWSTGTESTVSAPFLFDPQKDGTNTPPAGPIESDPSAPSTSSAFSKKEIAPAATENKANDDKTLEAVKAGESAEVKLYNDAAGISTGTMDILGASSGKLTVTNGKMTLTIPGGFGKITEAGRIYYPLDCIDNLANAGDIAAAVKDNAKAEVIKVGGNMQMPVTVTVTLKTKLTGTVNVYYYDDNTGKYTLLASPTAQDGKITFTTRQLGHMVLTAGRI